MSYNQIFYSRPTWIELDKKAILFNLRNISKKIPKLTKICAIIKSNAYGHGLCEIAKVISKSSCVKYLGVTAIEEAIILREKNVSLPILLFGSIFPVNNIKEILKYNITPTVSSVLMLKELNKFCEKNNKKINFHLKIDTGMGRIGLLPSGVKRFFDELNIMKNVFLEGIYTHFSSVVEDKKYTFEQLKIFKQVIAEIKNYTISQKILHTANSASTLLYKETYFDMIRPGLILYGLKPMSNADSYIKTLPVLSLKSKVVFLKTLPKGKFISYGKTFMTKKTTKIATVPIGYADGIMRKLSNRGKVLINGIFCNILGRVTMDMIMVDVTKVKNIKIGDEVVFIGRQGKNVIYVEDLAKLCETINYEICTSLSCRIPRILV